MYQAHNRAPVERALVEAITLVCRNPASSGKGKTTR